MPMTWPAELTSGPPESPATTFAFVSIIPCSVSELDRPALVAGRDGLVKPGDLPGGGDDLAPPFGVAQGHHRGPGLDLARVADRDRVQAGRVLQLDQRDVAGHVVADDLRQVVLTRRRDRRGDLGGVLDDVVVRQHQAVGALITMPVPAACSLLYCSVVLMITRPCSTLLRFPDAPDPPLLGAGTAVLGSGAGAIALLLGCGAADRTRRRVIDGHHRARPQQRPPPARRPGNSAGRYGAWAGGEAWEAWEAWGRANRSPPWAAGRSRCNPASESRLRCGRPGRSEARSGRAWSGPVLSLSSEHHEPDR